MAQHKCWLRFSGGGAVHVSSLEELATLDERIYIALRSIGFAIEWDSMDMEYSCFTEVTSSSDEAETHGAEAK